MVCSGASGVVVVVPSGLDDTTSYPLAVGCVHRNPVVPRLRSVAIPRPLVVQKERRAPLQTLLH